MKADYTKEENYLLDLLLAKQEVLNELTTSFNSEVSELDITPENAVKAITFVIKTVNEKQQDIHNQITQINIDKDARKN